MSLYSRYGKRTPAYPAGRYEEPLVSEVCAGDSLVRFAIARLSACGEAIAVRISCYHVDIENNRLYRYWCNPPCAELCVIAEGGKGHSRQEFNIKY